MSFANAPDESLLLQPARLVSHKGMSWALTGEDVDALFPFLNTLPPHCERLQFNFIR